MTVHILKADTPSPQVLAIAGDYEQMYTRILRRGGYTGPICAWDVEIAKEYPPDSAHGSADVFLISGSVKDAWSDIPWVLQLLQWTRDALTKGKRLIGVCFGHQIIARALGAPVGPAAHWELGVIPLDLTAEGRRILGPDLHEPALIQSHRDQVFELPVGATLLASTALGLVQSFYRPTSYFCIQGHPEFTDEVLKVMLDKHEPQIRDAGLSTLHKPHNGDDFGAIMARFIVGDI